MGHDGADDTHGLSRRQLTALPFLVVAPTMAEGARMASIGRSTLYRWINDPDFRDRLEALRADAAGLARAELNGLMFKGILALAQALEDPSPTIRLRAVQTTLAMGLKANDLHDMARRLDRVDEALHLWSSRNKRW
jgi:hypothetical protein